LCPGISATAANTWILCRWRVYLMNGVSGDLG
jgi:hypothetical protein